MLLVLAGEPVIAQIQSGTFHTIGLHSGYFYMANRDDLESPMRYSGATLPLMLSYGYRGDINVHSARLSFHSGSLESVLTSDRGHRIDATGGAIEYSYLHSIEIVQEPLLQTFFGVTWNNEVQIREHTYTITVGSESFVELFSSLSVTGQAEYRLSEREVMNARLSLPLVAFVLRPGYAVSPPAPGANPEWSRLKKGGRIASWGSFRGLAAEVGYNYSLSRYVDLSMRYALQFTYCSFPAPTMTFMSQFDFGLSIKI